MCCSVCGRVGDAAGDALRATLLAGCAGGHALCTIPFAGSVEGVGGAGRAGGDVLCATLLAGGAKGVGGGGGDALRNTLLAGGGGGIGGDAPNCCSVRWRLSRVSSVCWRSWR